MKVGKWTKKLSAALVAGGLMMPVSASAASLDANLIVDGGFEDATATGTDCCGRKVLNSWGDGAHVGGTYATGGYDVGGPLLGSGDNYFRASNLSDITQYGVNVGDVAQRVDLSLGDTGAAIAGGTATYSLSAYFSEGNRLSRKGLGTVQVDFRDSSDVSIATHEIGPNAVLAPDSPSGDPGEAWKLLSDGGVIPAGTDSVFVSVYNRPTGLLIEVPVGSEPVTRYERNSYIDNVGFQVSAVPEPASWALVVTMAMGVTCWRRRS